MKHRGRFFLPSSDKLTCGNEAPGSFPNWTLLVVILHFKCRQISVFGDVSILKRRQIPPARYLGRTYRRRTIAIPSQCPLFLPSPPTLDTASEWKVKIGTHVPAKEAGLDPLRPVWYGRALEKAD